MCGIVEVFLCVYEITLTAALDGFNAETDIGPTLKWGRKLLMCTGK